MISKHYIKVIKKQSLKFAFHGNVHRGLPNGEIENSIHFRVSIPKLKRIKVVNLKLRNY